MNNICIYIYIYICIGSRPYPELDETVPPVRITRLCLATFSRQSARAVQHTGGEAKNRACGNTYLMGLHKQGVVNIRYVRRAAFDENLFCWPPLLFASPPHYSLLDFGQGGTLVLSGNPLFVPLVKISFVRRQSEEILCQTPMIKKSFVRPQQQRSPVSHLNDADVPCQTQQ